MTTRVKTFKYSELSDRAKDNVRERYGFDECDSDSLTESLTEFATEFLGAASVDEKNGLSWSLGHCQSDHVSIIRADTNLATLELVNARIAKALEHGKCVDLDTGVMQDYPLHEDTAELYQHIYDESFANLCDELRGYGYGRWLSDVTVSIRPRHAGGGSTYGEIDVEENIYGMSDYDFEEPPQEKIESVMQRFYKAVKDYVHTLEQRMRRIGYDEIEYRNSDESMDEMAEANGWKFNETGRIV
jgi:hypothetical protein